MCSHVIFQKESRGQKKMVEFIKDTTLEHQIMMMMMITTIIKHIPKFDIG